MLVIPLACAGISAIVIAVTWTQIAAAYPALPPRIPMQFWFDGRPSSFGPRKTAYIPLLAQVFVAIAFLVASTLIAQNAESAHVGAGLAIEGTCTIAILWRASALTLAGAKNPERPVNMKPFWWTFAALMTPAMLSLIFSLL